MSSLRLSLLLLFLIATSTTHAQTSPPAFPGAEGFGAVATGGRGGQVIYVTNLNADGSGSLQEALDTPGARTILFKVSGVIDAVANIRYGDLTIAGQTSPGGVIVRGLVCDGHYENNRCDNLIIRHLRSRPAAHLGGAPLDDALRLDGLHNAIVDHGSFANASDEAVQISLAKNITLQDSILAETVGDHAERGGLLINYSHSTHPQDNLAIHHNLWYRIGGRMPEISCDVTAPIEAIGETQAETPSECSKHPLNIEVSNNLWWDSGYVLLYNNNADDTRGQPAAGIFTLNMNWVNNYAFARPDFAFGMIVNTVTAQPDNRLYFSGNRLNLYPDYADNDLAYCCNDFNTSHPNTEPPAAQMLTERHPFPTISYIPTEQVLPYMLANVGAFPRDPMDSRYIAAIQSGNIDPLPYDTPGAQDAFALNPNPPAPPADTDNDGLPDQWETANGLDPNTPDQNGTQLSLSHTGVEGYTNLEVYLNELADQRVKDGR